MSKLSVSNSLSRVYRLDKFLVPSASREEFLVKVQQTHAILNSQPGFIQDILLEKPATGESFTSVTQVEWENTEFLEKARAVIDARHKREGFSPRAMWDRLGIQAEIGNYISVRS